MPDNGTDLIPFLKEHGLRVTPQRLLILKTVFSIKDHPTVEDIHQKLPYISMATLYNNIKLFVKIGIFKELPYGTGYSKYEINKPDHYHIICDLCGKIADFNYPSLKEIENAASDLTNYSIKHHHLEFYGVCVSCQD
ncbi:Fur family transcriptional regulator [Mesobacillus harenae]|uniref:Fur family transcriptional regulator n=1 Tax=Mesobacillus harenae TaxID=2213203 RepID=UPI0024113DB1|nr:Fur family transcriptional regulator [Mesobacillus harenae]